jgi:3-deoxy-7-phosphoheptulonate synthase
MKQEPVQVGNLVIGDGNFVVMAGPCSVESEAQIFEMAALASECGAQILRGGAFKPRTSPYSFQGLGERGLQYLRRAADAHNLYTVTEVMDIETVELVAQYSDILQVGSRNMQNYSLLRRLGHVDKPIFLKRGQSATYEELLLAAEYIVCGGNRNIILCERGIRTFGDDTRNTLDLAAVPILKSRAPFPVVVDPSHGTGRRDLILPMSRASQAVGADGVMIEVHPNPDQALSDGEQSLDPDQFRLVMAEFDVAAVL